MTAIDLCPRAVETMIERGVADVFQSPDGSYLGFLSPAGGTVVA